MTLSGWCAAPAAMRPYHENCRWALCSCGCHTAPEPRETDDREDEQQ
jgi:hypothetical protein